MWGSSLSLQWVKSKLPYQTTYLPYFITKTCLHYFDPLKPHFYIVKLGLTLFFLFLLKNIDCGYSLDPPHRGSSNEYPQSMFCTAIWKISEFFIWKFSFFGCKIFNIFEWACFCNVSFSVHQEMQDTSIALHKRSSQINTFLFLLKLLQGSTIFTLNIGTP